MEGPAPEKDPAVEAQAFVASEPGKYRVKRGTVTMLGMGRWTSRSCSISQIARQHAMTPDAGLRSHHLPRVYSSRPIGLENGG